MKVKNIAFSGFAAMIFAGLCGAADATSVNLASKSYVDRQLESKANLIDLETLETTVGQKATQESLNTVATQVNQNTLDIADLKAAGYISDTDLDNAVSTLEAVDRALQDAIDAIKNPDVDKAYVDKEISNLNTAISNLQGADSSMSQTIAGLEALVANAATKEEIKDFITSSAVDSKIQDAVAGLATDEEVKDFVSSGMLQEEIAKLATKSEIANFVNSTQVSDAIADATKDLLTASDVADFVKSGDMTTAIANATKDLATKQDLADAKSELQAAIDGINAGQVELTNYYTKAQAEAMFATKAELPVIPTLVSAFINDAGYQTAGEVSTAIGAATANLASKTELNAKQNVINADNMLSSDFVSGLATVATSGQYADLQGKPDIPSIDGLAKSSELETLQSTLQAAIDEKQAKGSYADADALEALQETVQSLQNGVVDKETVENLQTSVETIAADYAKKSELTSTEQNLQAAINDVKDLIPTVPTNVSAFNNDAGYQTAGEVSTAIGAATANLASKTELNAKQNVINAENKLSAEYVSGLATVATTGSYNDLDDKPTIPSTENLATKDELNAKQNVINADNMLSSDFVSGLATVATTGSYNDLDDKPTIPSTENLVTKDELNNLQTALQAKINEMHKLGDYATAESLQAVSESLATLEGNVYTKAQVDAKIADAVSGGEIDLSGYAKQVDLDSLTALVNGNTAEITTLKNAGYQTSTQVSEAIDTATATLATKDELNAKQDTLTAGTGITITDNTISASVDTSSFMINPTNPGLGDYVLYASCTSKKCVYSLASVDEIMGGSSGGGGYDDF